jgi:HAD superfamily hydrolase (TIGR01490 family)
MSLVHLFDVDYTLVRKSTTWYFIREALADRVIRMRDIWRLPFEFIRYKLGLANTGFIEEGVKRLAGIDRELLEKTAEACFEKRLKPAIYAEGAALIAALKKQGTEVIFATSSFHTLIRPLEKFFGISGSIASTLEFENGRTSGRLVGRAFFGAYKKEAAEAWAKKRGLGLKDIRFYSDSYTDLPLLEACGSPVAVNPDRFLTRTARKKGWEILRFGET